MNTLPSASSRPLPAEVDRLTRWLKPRLLAQLDHLEGGRITLLKQDYRGLQGRYDRLISVEMIEAVGHHYLDTYLATLDRLLADDGLALADRVRPARTAGRWRPDPRRWLPVPPATGARGPAPQVVAALAPVCHPHPPLPGLALASALGGRGSAISRLAD